MVSNDEGSSQKRQLTIAAGSALVVALVVALVQWKADDSETSIFEVGIGEPTVETPTPGARGADSYGDPIEFVLELKDNRYEVTSQPIPVATSRMTLKPKAARRFVADGWSFTYPRGVSVASDDDVQVVSGDLFLRLHPLRGDSAEDEVLDALSKFLMPRKPEPSRRQIGAAEVVGRKFSTADGTTIEVFAPKLSDDVRLGVVLQTGATGPKIPFVDAVLGSLRAGDAEPLPLFEGHIDGRTVQLTLDRATKIAVGAAEVTVTLRRRDTVRRRLGRLSLEHDHRAAVSPMSHPEGELLSFTSAAGQVVLAFGDLTVNEAALQRAVSRYMVFQADRPSSREVAGRQHSGMRGVADVGVGKLTAERYAYRAHGGIVVVLLTYDDASEDDAWAMAAPIWASLQSWADPGPGLAQAIAIPKSTPPPEKVQAQLKRCDAGDIEACNDAALWFGESDGGRLPDHVKALALYDKTCKGGSPLGCRNAGIMADNGWGGAADPKRARILYGKACKLNPYYGCNNLAVMLRRGEGAKADPKRALTLFDQACKAGIELACYNLASMHEKGEGTKQNARLARGKYEGNCRRGHVDSCVRAAFLHGEGAAGDANPNAAKRFYRKACRLGDTASCEPAGMDHDGDEDDDLEDDAEADYMDDEF